MTAAAKDDTKISNHNTHFLLTIKMTMVDDKIQKGTKFLNTLLLCQLQ